MSTDGTPEHPGSKLVQSVRVRTVPTVPTVVTWSAVVGVVVVILWPAMHQWGALAARDLLILPSVPMPSALFWLGPGLARRFPGFVPLAGLSHIIGGYAAGRLMLVATLVATGIGVARLVRTLLPAPAKGAARIIPAVAGVVVLCMPFTLTRLSTGHLTTLWGLAVLPYLLIIAARGASVSRSRPTSAGALLGFVSGAYAFVVLAGTFRRDNARAGFAAWLVRNLVWIVPGAFLQAQGFTSLVDPKYFRPIVPDATAVFGLVVGRGYWDAGAEVVRGNDTIVCIAAGMLIALAAVGFGEIPRHLRRVFALCMVVGYGIPLAASLPGVGDVVRWITLTPIGAPLREPHRLVGLGVVPAVVLAAVGMAHLTLPRPLRALLYIAYCAPLLWLLVLALPTVHARLQPVALPGSWGRAANIVHQQGGAVLALPWSEYVLLDIDRPRVVYSPLPDLFGDDTLASSDPQLGPPVDEAADPRAALGAKAADQLMNRRDASVLLNELGVRWVAVLRVELATSLDLSDVSTLELVVHSDTLDLYRVRATPSISELDRSVPPAGRQQASADAVSVPWTAGWLGISGLLGRTDSGLLQGPGQGSWAVFLPAIPAVGLYLSTVLELCKPGLLKRVLRPGRKGVL